MSAVFDLVDHEILLQRLEISVAFTVLHWLSSYLTNICFSVCIGHQSSSCLPLNCGVPQGSILGQVLFYPVYATSGFQF